ncbi:hypothetical protein KIPB_008768 [Kipferlia bialata]|uniref:Pre-mRNA-splicing factor 3 domain-containing protein n=1 Tax=Kipferlia bialata TaxID=797122 RepID=A0A9K3D2E2_9EUKA|nr:hypothetical protein KIPB_008768 [Kipferlia bialata]|eukprot:g8768.t1
MSTPAVSLTKLSSVRSVLAKQALAKKRESEKKRVEASDALSINMKRRQSQPKTAVRKRWKISQRGEEKMKKKGRKLRIVPAREAKERITQSDSAFFDSRGTLSRMDRPRRATIQLNAQGTASKRWAQRGGRSSLTRPMLMGGDHVFSWDEGKADLYVQPTECLLPKPTDVEPHPQAGAHAYPPDLPAYLTLKEQRRLRHLNRLRRAKERELRIQMGQEEARPAKVTLANMSRVLVTLANMSRVLGTSVSLSVSLSLHINIYLPLP